MKNKYLTFGEKHDEYYHTTHDVFTFSVAGRPEEYIYTIKALLDILGGVSDDHCGQEQRYYICSLIRDMLPSHEQIEMIAQSQK